MDDLRLTDRGNIKWTSMMLSEQREALYELEQSQEDVDPPNKTEDELGELAERLLRAMQCETEVTITHWKSKRNYEIVGTVKRIDPINKAILIDASTDDEWDQQWVLAVHIVDVVSESI